MADVIDICHYRRAQRLFRLLLRHSGIETFLAGADEVSYRIDPARLDDAVALAASWLEMQTDRPLTAATEALMRTDLRRLLIRSLARHLVDTGY